MISNSAEADAEDNDDGIPNGGPDEACMNEGKVIRS